MTSLRRVFLVLLGLGVVSSLTLAQLTKNKTSIAFGSQTVFVPKLDSFYVKNTGASDVAITAVTNTAGVYVVSPRLGSLTPTIAAGDSFYYNVAFTATAVGAAPLDTIVLTSAAETLKVALSGTGVNDVRLYNPRTGGQYTTSFTFVAQLAGAQRLDSVTIKNLNTTSSIDVTAMTFTNPEFSTITTLPVTINANDSAKIYMAYTGSNLGRDLDTLTIVHTGAATASSPIKIAVTGTATSNFSFHPASGANGVSTFSDSSAMLTTDVLTMNAVHRGARGVSLLPLIAVDSLKLGRIIIRNNGTTTMHIDSIAVGGPHFIIPPLYKITGLDQQPGASYDRYFTFALKAKIANAAGIIDTFYVYHKDTVVGSNPLKAIIRAGSANRVYVTNVGTAAAIAFGSVPLGTTIDGMIRVHNYQVGDLTIDSVKRVTNIPQIQVMRNLQTTIPAGMIDTMVVRWSTTDTTTLAQKDTVVIYAPSYFVNPVKFPITGQTIRTISFVPATPLSFGTVQLETFKDTVIRMYNRTDTNYTITGISLFNDPNSKYLISSNTLSQSFNAGDSLLIQLRFTPTALGSTPDTILISHNMPPNILATNPYKFVLNGTGIIGGIDPKDYLTVDNIQGPEGVPIQSADSSYWETGPFWENAGGSYGVGHRRSPNLAGRPNGSTARYTYTLDQTGPYLVYHYCTNSPNVGQSMLFQMEKGGYGGIWDSLRYNLQDHVTGTTSIVNAPTGTWLPIQQYYFYGLGKGSAVLRIGADAVSGAFMRVDATRLLRSRLTADIEFGRRDLNFAAARVPEEFPATTLGDETQNKQKPYRLFNLGSDTLKITDIQFFTAGGSSRPVPWFYVKNATYPILVPPMTADGQGREQNGYTDINLVFSPYQEGTARDSMVIFSNDVNESKAYIILLGDAFNINFVMNASLGNTEPHFRAPAPPDVATAPRYFEGAAGSWANSAVSTAFPIPGGNTSSRVNVGDFTGGTHQAFYKFELPEMYGGRINAAGNYILEFSGPITTNGATAATVIVTNELGNQIVPTDSATNFNQNRSAPVIWQQIGGTGKTFPLYPGAATQIEFRRYNLIGAGFLRVDLLRMRKVPTGALIGTSVNTAAGDSIYFGEVNFRDPAGTLGTANKRNLIIKSIGESQLQINSMRLLSGPGSKFNVGAPALPQYLRAIVGELQISLAFSPDSIKLNYRDTLEILTNSTRDSVLRIPLVGHGIGGVFVFDDNDAPAVYGQPAFGGLYVTGWDFANMTKWQAQPMLGKVDSAAQGSSRRMLAIYQNPTGGYFDWYPLLPTEVGAGDSMYAEVRVTMSPSQTKASPAARYQVWTAGNVLAKDTILSQNGRTLQTDGTVPQISLGRYMFLRGGRDVSGTAIFGYVRLLNDTGAVSAVYAGLPTNLAKRDTFALQADAVILRELALPQITTGVVQDGNAMPFEYSLSQNYPNPFNPTTTIRFGLAEQTNVELKIYDLLGREIRTLVRGDLMNAGSYRIVWDGRNGVNQPVSTGVYFYRISAGGFVQVKKMLMLK